MAAASVPMTDAASLACVLVVALPQKLVWSVPDSFGEGNERGSGVIGAPKTLRFLPATVMYSMRGGSLISNAARVEDPRPWFDGRRMLLPPHVLKRGYFIRSVGESVLSTGSKLGGEEAGRAAILTQRKWRKHVSRELKKRQRADPLGVKNSVVKGMVVPHTAQDCKLYF